MLVQNFTRVVFRIRHFQGVYVMKSNVKNLKKGLIVLFFAQIFFILFYYGVVDNIYNGIFCYFVFFFICALAIPISYLILLKILLKKDKEQNNIMFTLMVFPVLFFDLLVVFMFVSRLTGVQI